MKQSWKIPAICGILMVVFNVIVFALPIYKTPVVLISDIAVVIAIAAQIPISSIAMKKGTTVTSKVYGWPIISVGPRSHNGMCNDIYFNIRCYFNFSNMASGYCLCSSIWRSRDRINSSGIYKKLCRRTGHQT